METTSRLRARPTAKTAENFWLNLDHANVTFGQIIVERRHKIIDKGKNLAALLAETLASGPQASGQIARFGFLDAAAFGFGPANRWGAVSMRACSTSC